MGKREKFGVLGKKVVILMEEKLGGVIDGN